MKKFTLLLAVFTLSVFTAFAYQIPAGAGQIELKGDNLGASSLEGEYLWTGAYKYLGYATLLGADATYTGLKITYTGDITSLRLQFVKGNNVVMSDPIWFDPTQQSHFVTFGATAIPLKPTSSTTIYIDLANSGIDMSLGYDGIHMHVGDSQLQPSGGTFTVTKAYMFQAGTSGIGKINSDGKEIVGYYSVIGAKLSGEPQHGIFIVKYSDGTSEKCVK